MLNMKNNNKLIGLLILIIGISSSVTAQEKVTQESMDKIKQLLYSNNSNITQNNRPKAIFVTPESERYIDPSTLNIKFSFDNGSETTFRKKPVNAVLIKGEEYLRIKEKIVSNN